MINNPTSADYQKREQLTAEGIAEQQVINEQMRLDTNRRRMSVMLIGLASLALGLMAVGLFTTGAWQYVATTVISLLALAVTIVSNRLVKRQRFDFAAYSMIFAVFMIFDFPGLFLSEADWVFVAGGMFFINIVGSMILPRTMRSRTFVVSSILTAIPLFPRIVDLPWERYQLLTSAGQFNFFYIIVFFAVITLVAELFISYRRIVNLGVRLSVIFGVVVVVAVTSVTLISLVVVNRQALIRGTDELQTITRLKHSAIQSWIGSLHSELSTVLIESYELDRARTVLLGESNLEVQATATRELRTRFNNVIERNFNFTEIFIANLDGQVMLSSNLAGDDKWVDHEPWFVAGKNSAYVDQPRYSLSDEDLVMVFSQPLYDQVGIQIGIIAGKANLLKLNSLVSASPSGITGKTYLVAGNHEIVGEKRYVYSEGIEAVLQGETASATYDDYDGVRVLGHYLRVPEFGAGLMNELDEDEVLTSGRRTIMITNGIAAVVIAAIAVIVAILVAQTISRPLNGLVETAGRVSEGEFDLRAEITSEDELGTLAQAFNSMTAQLQTFIADLEQRVQDRTDGLAAVGEVTRATTSQLDINQLLPSVANTVRDRFGLYYVGLFMVEDRQDGSQVAVLRAATGEAGEQMMAQNWQLDVGTGSMIGNSIFTGQPRTRQSATELGPWQRNPYLPDTESELALPLRFGDQILGSMTVQSTIDNAFDDPTIDLLQNMADQVSVAIENARLYTESQRALDQARVIQQRYQTQAWREYLAVQDVRGAAYSEMEGVRVVHEATVSTLADDVVIDDGKLLIPIMQGSQQVGVMGFEGKVGDWQPEEIELLQTLAEQLSQAAENQRLLDETEQRAAREQTLGRVADSLRQSLDMETVLSTAAGEIREALGLDRIVVRLAEPGQND